MITVTAEERLQLENAGLRAQLVRMQGERDLARADVLERDFRLLLEEIARKYGANDWHFDLATGVLAPPKEG